MNYVNEQLKYIAADSGRRFRFKLLISVFAGIVFFWSGADAGYTDKPDLLLTLDTLIVSFLMFRGANWILGAADEPTAPAESAHKP
jgi:hypothetical protein